MVLNWRELNCAQFCPAVNNVTFEEKKQVFLYLKTFFAFSPVVCLLFKGAHTSHGLVGYWFSPVSKKHFPK